MDAVKVLLRKHIGIKRTVRWIEDVYARNRWANPDHSSFNPIIQEYVDGKLTPESIVEQVWEEHAAITQKIQELQQQLEWPDPYLSKQQFSRNPAQYLADHAKKGEK